MTIAQHLQDRRLDSSLHTVWVDEVEGVATFPLWNLSGQWVAFQQYRPSATKKKDNHPRDSRYFTWRKAKVVGVWGLESWRLSNTLYVTEGLFDACSLTALGYSAVATLSNDVDASTMRWFAMVRRMRPVVVFHDDDAAGRKLMKLGHVAATTGHKDLGDTPLEVVHDMAELYARG